MECPICMETLSGEVFSTSCGHVFCICIQHIVNSSAPLPARCPSCLQFITMDGIKKIFLPGNVVRPNDSYNDAIVQSLVHDLESEKKKTEKRFQEMSKLFESLTGSFSKIDSTYDTIVFENKELKKENAEMKEEFAKFKEALLQRAKEEPELMLKDLFDEPDHSLIISL